MRRAVGVLSPIISLCCDKGKLGEPAGSSIPGELSGTRNVDGDVAASTLQDYQTRVVFTQEHLLEDFTNREATRLKLLPRARGVAFSLHTNTARPRSDSVNCRRLVNPIIPDTAVSCIGWFCFTDATRADTVVYSHHKQRPANPKSTQNDGESGREAGAPAPGSGGRER